MKHNTYILKASYIRTLKSCHYCLITPFLFTQIYKWTEVEKSRVLSSFFWGYIALQIFFGNLVGKRGTKNILTAAVTVSSLCTVVIPLVSDYGYTVVVALRVIEGLAQVRTVFDNILPI